MIYHYNSAIGRLRVQSNLDWEERFCGEPFDLTSMPKYKLPCGYCDLPFGHIGPHEMIIDKKKVRNGTVSQRA